MSTQQHSHIRRYSLILLAVLTLAAWGYGQEQSNSSEVEGEPRTQSERVEFEGFPDVRLTISNNGKFYVSSDVMESDDSTEHGVRIIETGGRYYWASRNMTEMSKTVSGAFTTYAALNGSGYVRTGFDALEELASAATDEDRPRVVYTEHLLNGFLSITYVGLSETPAWHSSWKPERRGDSPT